MATSSSNNILLVGGTGYMGQEYIKALKKLNQPFTVIGNKKEKCELVSQSLQIPILSGGLENYFESLHQHDYAILATPIETLEDNLTLLLNNGVKNILLEKPGGLSLERLNDLCERYPESRIVLAYNRRFYASTEKAREIIRNDNGVTSFSMEITELVHRVPVEKFSQDVLRMWFLCMTTHVVDLGFYLGGEPASIHSLVRAGKDWYSDNGIFAGSGETLEGSIFSYHGNWRSAGRWRLELCTDNHRIIFSPLEKLQIQRKGEMNIQDVPLDLTNEKDIKPGIFLQVQTFIQNPNDPRFLTLEDQCQRMATAYHTMTHGELSDGTRSDTGSSENMSEELNERNVNTD